MRVACDVLTWTIQREPNEPRCTSESAFWYRLRNHLRARGHDVIKKCPARDGHMTSAPYYLRDRKGAYAISDGYAAIRSPHTEFNAYEPVYLTYHQA